MIIIKAVAFVIGFFISMAAERISFAATGVADALILFRELPLMSKWVWGISLFFLLVAIGYVCFKMAISKKPRGWIP